MNCKDGEIGGLKNHMYKILSFYKNSHGFPVKHRSAARFELRSGEMAFICGLSTYENVAILFAKSVQIKLNHSKRLFYKFRLIPL